MDDVSRTLHLMKRGETWYYRRRVPERLVPVVGKTFIRYSLKTESRAEAIKRRTVEEVKTDALFEEADKQLQRRSANRTEAPSPVPMEVLVEDVRKYVAAKDKQFADWLAANPPSDTFEVHELRKDIGLDLTLFMDPVPGHDEAVSHATDAVLNATGLKIDDPDTVAHMADFVRRGTVEYLRRKLDRLEHRLDRPFHDVMFDPDRKPAITFGTVAETFLDERRKDYALNGVAQPTSLAFQNDHVVHELHRNPKPRRRRPLRMTLFNKGDHALTKLYRKWLAHHWPPYLPCRQGITDQHLWES